MAMSRREPRGPECLRLGAHINTYDFPQAMHPTSQHPHKLVATASHRTTNNQPNRSAYPGTKPGHADDRAHCPDAQTTVRRPPYAGTHHGRQGPGQHHRGPRNTACASRSYTLQRIAQLRHDEALTPRIPSLPPHTRTPRARRLRCEQTTPPGQAHLQPIRHSYSFAQGGSRGNRGWPGHRHPETATPHTARHRNADTSHNVPSTSPLG